MLDSNTVVRRFKAAVWNPTPNVLSSATALVEKQLGLLGSFKLINIKSVNEIQEAALSGEPFDFVLSVANFIPEEDFGTWLIGLEKRIAVQNVIKTPFILISDVPFAVVRDLMVQLVDLNWYVDIIALDHLSSLPIRVTNFIRLHDHLQEVKRLSDILSSLTQQVNDLESQSETIRQALKSDG